MFFPFCFSVFVRTGRDAAHSGCARGTRRPSTVQRAGARKDGGGVASREKTGDLPFSRVGFVHLPLNKMASPICPSNDLDSNSTRF